MFTHIIFLYIVYGFRKVYLSNNLQKEEQKEVWYFRHENFKKDNPELLHNIERHTNKTETDDTRQQIAKKTQQASGYEEELKEINSKLEVATEKSEGLKNYVKELYTVQMNQQEVCKTRVDVAWVDGEAQ